MVKFSVVVLMMMFVALAASGATFTECPPVGADTLGCQILITVTAVDGSGNATAFSTADSTTDTLPFDDVEDTLVGVLNSSGGVLKAIAINGGAGSGIFGFDGDGACSGLYSPNPTTAQCGGAYTTTDPTDYASSTATFGTINPSLDSGTVLVGGSSGLANGGTAWFSLEESFSASQITLGGGGTPEPATFGLIGAGLTGLYFIRRRSKA